MSKFEKIDLEAEIFTPANDIIRKAKDWQTLKHSANLIINDAKKTIEESGESPLSENMLSHFENMERILYMMNEKLRGIEENARYITCVTNQDNESEK